MIEQKALAAAHFPLVLHKVQQFAQSQSQAQQLSVGPGASEPREMWTKSSPTSPPAPESSEPVSVWAPAPAPASERGPGGGEGEVWRPSAARFSLAENANASFPSVRVETPPASPSKSHQIFNGHPTPPVSASGDRAESVDPGHADQPHLLGGGVDKVAQAALGSETDVAGNDSLSAAGAKFWRGTHSTIVTPTPDRKYSTSSERRVAKEKGNLSARSARRAQGEKGPASRFGAGFFGDHFASGHSGVTVDSVLASSAAAEEQEVKRLRAKR